MPTDNQIGTITKRSSVASPTRHSTISDPKRFEPRFVAELTAMVADLTPIASTIHSRSREWIDGRLCADVPLEQFYPTTSYDRPSDELMGMCVRCPVRVECLAVCSVEEASVMHHYGMRAGTTVDERRVLARRFELDERICS